MSRLHTASPDLVPDPERQDLATTLTLTQLDDSLFQGRSRPGRPTRTFGGEVLGQAMMAAGATVDADRAIHSAYAYFVLPGDSSRPVTYRVARVRDGGSFTTRSVEAIQRDRTIFTAMLSFARPGAEGALQHQALSSPSPDPETLPDPADEFADEPVNQAWYDWLIRAQPIDIRFPEPISRVLSSRGEPGRPRQRVWMRAHRPFPAGPSAHSAILAYLSDLFLLSAALGPHDRELGDGTLQFATLDHGIWFHAPLDPGDWFLYDMDGFWAGQDRALCRGYLFDRAGTLCASTLQEGLLRRTS